MEEIWRDVQGYEGLYQISNWGRVKSFRQSTKFRKQKEYLLKPSLINSGYGVVTFYSNGEKRKRKYQIHRLVATEFIPNPENLPCVNHKDENKLNNRVENLEWCTYDYNNKYGTARERINATIKKRVKQRALDGRMLAVYRSIPIASMILGETTETLETWCNDGIGGGYRWEYTENM